MINLIPPHARKDVKLEYWVRVVSVWLFLMSFALIITGVLMVPSLVSIQSQLQWYNNSFQQASLENEANKQLEENINRANTIAQKLIQDNNTILFSSILSDIQKATNNTIIINTVSITRQEEDAVGPIQLAGIAESRGALVTFRDTLESYDMFDSIELPLSNLAKDKDIPFNITVTVSVPKTP